MSKITRRLSQLSLHDLLVVGLPLLALLVAGFWVAAQFVKPAPPDELVITTGGEGGAYQSFAARYKEYLAGYGIRLVERPSAGSTENLKRLLDPAQSVDIGFVQGGTPNDPSLSDLRSLGSLYFEPLWIFYRGAPGLTRIEQLAGKRLAIGPEGSGTRKLAVELLEAHGLAEGRTTLVPTSGLAAVDALQSGAVDAVFVVGAPRSASVWLLLHMEGVSLFSFSQADAYARRYPHLSRLTLPNGAISFVRDIPPADVTLISPVATLVVREDTHPALIDLLLQAMVHAHREADLFQRPGEFPNGRQTDFPLHQRAERFYQSGPPFLQRYLPFWVANFIDRILVMLLPLVALLIPVVKIAPSLYGWRVRARIYRWYGELKFLELEAETDLGARSREDWLAGVDRIEESVNRTRAPLAYTDYVYTLRQHIELVRERLLARLEASGRTASRAGGAESERP